MQIPGVAGAGGILQRECAHVCAHRAPSPPPEGMGLPRWAFHPGGSDFSGAAALLSHCILQILTLLGHCCSHSGWMFFSPILTSLSHSDFGPEITDFAQSWQNKTIKREGTKQTPQHFYSLLNRWLLAVLSSAAVTPWLWSLPSHLGTPWAFLEEFVDKNTLQGGRISEQTADPAGFQACSTWRTIRINMTNGWLFAITLTALFNTCYSSLWQADTHENLAVDNI